MPEIVEDHVVPGQRPEILRHEPAQREDLEERAAGEQHDQEHRDEEAWNRVADDDHARRPHVEARSIRYRFADAERNRDGVGDQRHPQAQRDRHRHALEDQLEHARIAEIALAEIEAGIVPDHQAEALIGRLVEAELLFEAGDELRIETLRAAVFRGHRGFAARHALLVVAAAGEIAAASAELGRGADIGAGELGDQPLNRAAWRELHDDERHQHDAKHGGDDQENAAKDIGGQGREISCR